MQSKAKEMTSTAETMADASGQDETAANMNWLEAELLACGVPRFGLDQWLRHFMQEALLSDMTDETLLNFFCLARDKAVTDEPDFVAILTRTEAALFARLPDGIASMNADAEDAGYEPDEHADAMEALCEGRLSDRLLVEIFDLSATLRGETEFGPMWQAVMYLSRVQLLGRMKRVRQRPPAPTADGNENGDSEENDHVSMREALRVAEEAFRPDISDAKLLELYVLVGEHYNPDEEVFDEIAEAVNVMVFDRLRRGSPDAEFERHLENFDYPDHGKRALKAALKGRLPHRNLLMLYRLSWDSNDPTWLAVQDLCRGQLLERMNSSNDRGGRDWREWKLLRLTKRVQVYR